MYSMLLSWIYNRFSSTPKSPVTQILLLALSFVVRASKCVCDASCMQKIVHSLKGFIAVLSPLCCDAEILKTIWSCCCLGFVSTMPAARMHDLLVGRLGDRSY